MFSLGNFLDIFKNNPFGQLVADRSQQGFPLHLLLNFFKFHCYIRPECWKHSENCSNGAQLKTTLLICLFHSTLKIKHIFYFVHTTKKTPDMFFKPCLSALSLMVGFLCLKCYSNCSGYVCGFVFYCKQLRNLIVRHIVS